MIRLWTGSENGNKATAVKNILIIFHTRIQTDKIEPMFFFFFCFFFFQMPLFINQGNAEAKQRESMKIAVGL